MANLAPLQSGDGSQPVAAGTFHVGNFGPSPTPQINTNVAAPLDVRGAPGQASFLAAQLQQSLSALRFPAMEAARAQGMQRARQMTAQGMADAMSGNIDPELAAKDAAYNSGAVKVTAQKAAIQTVGAWQQFATDPANGLDKMTPQQIVDTQDQFFRKHLGGLENNASAAVAIEPIVTHAMNETLGRTIQYQSAQRFEDGLNNAATLAASQAIHGGANVGVTGKGVFNYQDQLNTLTTLAGGNRAVAKAQLDGAITQTAIAQNNAGILDAIQTAPGQALAPRTAEMVQEARLRIQANNLRLNTIKDKLAQTNAYQAILGGTDARTAVQTYLAHSPLASPDAIPRLLSFGKWLNDTNASQAASGADAADLNGAIVQGTLSTPAQIQDWITAKGYGGKAAVDLMKEGLSMSATVSRENTDNPYYRSTVQALSLRYRPKTPLPGMGIDQSQAAQYSGVMQDFANEYTKAVQGTQSPAQAAFTAQQAIEKKYGDPMSALTGKQAARVPETDAEQVHLLLSDPKQAKAVGVSSNDLRRLYALGMLTSSQVATIGRAYLTK